MALIGKPFQDYVKNQVAQRQESLGEGFGGTNTPRKLNTLNVYNSSTPWMRLASAVSITKPTEDSPGISVYQQILDSGLFDGFGENVWRSRGLAKNFVLQGAPNSIKSGVNIAPNDAEKAYGFGYGSSQINSEQGYVPPPGITNIDFEYKNDGALAFATVSIKAFSATQFSMVDILYMRPGYTCLLEFGHSMYHNNKGELINFSPSFTSPFGYLFNPDSSPSYTTMAEKIQKEKKKHHGNYEGFFARIMKFNWKFNMDGSYDITVKLAGLGSVITSLKTNIPKMTETPSTFNSNFKLKPFPTSKEKKEDNSAAEEEKAFIISDALESQLNFELYAFFADKEKYKDSEGSFLSFFTDKFDSNIDFKGYDVGMSEIPIGGEKKSYTIERGLVKFDVNDLGGTKYSPTTLIKFGVFLSMLQKICNITDGEGKNTLIQFEMVSDISQGLEEQKKLDDTFIYTYPGNFSSNPNKCLIKYSDYDYNFSPNEALNVNTGVNKILTKLSNEGEENAIKNLPNPSLAMRLSDVYININFIAEVLRNLRGTDPEAENEIDVSIMDLLKGILSGVNTSLGGLNDFRVIYSEETSRINIISEIPGVTQEIDSPSTTLSTLNTYGFDTTTPQSVGGSFVTSVDINSELTDQMATQISIGAQNNSNTINGNSTSFSIYSKGLIDTLMVEKKSPLEDEKSPLPLTPQQLKDQTDLDALSLVLVSGTSAEVSTAYDRILEITERQEKEAKEAEEEKETKPSDEYIAKLDTIFKESEFRSSFLEVYNNRQFDDTSYISGLEKVSLSISSLMTGESTRTKNSPAPFFLPFNMSLEMRGLGGIRIFDAFSINGKGLPLSYDPKSIKLIVKSLSHTVSLDGWKTKISTLPQPIFPVISTPGAERPYNPYSSTTSLQRLNEDPYPTINPSGIGSNTYENSQLAITMKASGFKNAVIPLDKLVFIGETNNARSTYTNPATGKPEYMLHPDAANAWFRWRKEMNANGIKYRVSSAYRDFAHQKSLGSKNTVAGAGSSPHGWGGALDFGNLYQIVRGSGDAEVNLQGRKTEAYKQIAEIGAKHGFYNPKRLAKTWGTNEIWHFEYWGAVNQISIY